MCSQRKMKENKFNMIKLLRKIFKKEKPITKAFKNLGQTIKQTCKAQGISSQQLADHVGVEVASIERFFEGCYLMSYDHLHSICELLNLNMSEMLKKSREEE